MEVAAKIKEYITNNSLSIDELAEAAEITKEELTRMLEGAQPLDAISYYYICKALKVPFNKFFEEQKGDNMTEEDKLYEDELRNKAYSDYERLNTAIDELERLCEGE